MKIDSENEFNNQDGNQSDNKKDFEVDINHILLNAKRASSHLNGFDSDETDAGVDQVASAKDDGKKNKPVNKKKSKKWIYITLILIFLFSAGAFGYYKFYMNNDKNIVKTEWGNVAFDVPQSEDMVNILAIGFDKGGYRTDTMMIINFNPKTSKVNLISIPRDTMVEINGKRMKLNSVFAIGKFELTVSTIKKITGLPIHYYVAVDTVGFKNIIDTLGGVDFNVEQDLKYTDPTQGLYIDLKKGMQHLDGAKAEQLVRFRKYPTADLAREDVQKKFIKALIEQKLTLANVSNIPKMKTLYDELTKYVKTNVTFTDLTKYFISALKINSESFATYTLPGGPKMINGISYYLYSKKQTQELYEKIMGMEVGSKIDLSQGVDVDDVQNMAKSSTKKTQTPVTNKSSNTSSTTTHTEATNDSININDGKDIEINDVGVVKPTVVKPTTKKDNNTKSSTQTNSESKYPTNDTKTENKTNTSESTTTGVEQSSDNTTSKTTDSQVKPTN